MRCISPPPSGPLAQEIGPPPVRPIVDARAMGPAAVRSRTHRDCTSPEGAAPNSNGQEKSPRARAGGPADRLGQTFNPPPSRPPSSRARASRSHDGSGSSLQIADHPAKRPHPRHGLARRRRSRAMLPCIAVAFRCPAALAPVHPASRLALHGWGAARLARSGPGMAARGLRQPARFRLHGVVRLFVHFPAPRCDGGIRRQSPPARLR